MENRFNLLDRVAVISKNITGTLSAATAGTVYTGFLPNAPILDSNNDDVGGFKNNSFTESNSVFTNEVPSVSLIISNGDYFINYKTGYYKVKAGATAVPTYSYYIKSMCVTTV